MKKIIVFAVHPDDETLGSGGTLLKHKANGDEIHWLICTSLDVKDKNYQRRELEINKVNEMYKFDSIHNLRLPTTTVDEFPIRDLIKLISNIFFEIKPNTIYIPFKQYIHSYQRKIF